MTCLLDPELAERWSVVFNLVRWHLTNTKAEKNVREERVTRRDGRRDGKHASCVSSLDHLQCAIVGVGCVDSLRAQDFVNRQDKQI